MRRHPEVSSQETEAALSHFKAVTEVDEGDAYAAYFAGQCHLQMGQFEQALELFRRSLTVDPYLRSAYYGAFLARQRLGDGAGEFRKQIIICQDGVKRIRTDVEPGRGVQFIVIVITLNLDLAQLGGLSDA